MDERYVVLENGVMDVSQVIRKNTFEGCIAATCPACDAPEGSYHENGCSILALRDRLRDIELDRDRVAKDYDSLLTERCELRSRLDMLSANYAELETDRNNLLLQRQVAPEFEVGDKVYFKHCPEELPCVVYSVLDDNRLRAYPLEDGTILTENHMFPAKTWLEFPAGLVTKEAPISVEPDLADSESNPFGPGPIDDDTTSWLTKLATFQAVAAIVLGGLVLLNHFGVL